MANPVTTLRDITVPYKRLMNTTTGQADLTSVGARASFLVQRPEDAWQFLRDISGRIQNLGSDGASLAYRIPLQFPENKDLYASCAQITYGGARHYEAGAYTYNGPSGLGPNPYGYAKVDVDFQFYPFSFQDAQWRSFQMRTSGNFYTIPYRVYHFSDGTQTGADIGFLVPEQELSYTRYWLPSLGIITPTIYQCSGRVNTLPFGDDRLDPGTVLFVGGDSTQAQSVMGNMTNDVQLNFRYRYIPWNKFMHPNGTSGFQTVYDGAGNSPFPDTDLNVLLAI